MKKLMLISLSALFLSSCQILRIIPTSDEKCGFFVWTEVCENMHRGQCKEDPDGGSCEVLERYQSFNEYAGPPEEEEPLEVIVEPEEPKVIQNSTPLIAPSVDYERLVTNLDSLVQSKNLEGFLAHFDLGQLSPVESKYRIEGLQKVFEFSNPSCMFYVVWGPEFDVVYSNVYHETGMRTYSMEGYLEFWLKAIDSDNPNEGWIIIDIVRASPGYDFGSELDWAFPCPE